MSGEKNPLLRRPARRRGGRRCLVARADAMMGACVALRARRDLASNSVVAAVRYIVTNGNLKAKVGPLLGSLYPIERRGIALTNG